MEQLSDIQLLNFRGFTIDLLQVASIVLVGGVGFFIYWLLEYRIFPWYYGLDTTSERNRERMRRVTRFTLVSFFVVGVLRILEIDYSFSFLLQSLEDLDPETVKRMEQADPDGANDGSGLRFVMRISFLVEVFVAYVIANLLDIVLGEIVTQRFHRKKTQAKAQGLSTPLAGSSGRVKWLRPLLYTLVFALFASQTGLAKYQFFSLPSDAGEPATVITLARIINAALVLLVISLLLNFVITFLLKGYYQRSKIDTGSQFSINRLLTYFVYFIGILLVIQTAGFNLVGIWTGAAALLVGIGIGLQQTFNDLICGVIILFERSVKVGDVVELTGHQVGTVRKVGARTSIVETRDDIIIFVPNSKLIGENVTNWSQVERKARFHVGVGVAYGSDTALVKEILFQVAKDHNRVLDSPPPIVRFLDFGDSSLNFEVIFWSRDFMRIEDTKSDLRFAIDAAFRARNVEIPFPQRDLWIRGGLPSTISGHQEKGADAGAKEAGKAEPPE